MRVCTYVLAAASLFSTAADKSLAAEPADLIIHGGKIVTVDRQFSVQQAMAVRSDRIVKLGSNNEVLALRGDQTKVINLAGKSVLPGLIDSHVHPTGAAMHEFDHDIPEMHTIADVLDYIKSRSDTLEDGQWIVVRQVFITRLAEQRYPTREELDYAAPNNPVMFSTGPDASLNTLALKESGIDKNFKVVGRGYIERDPQTGEPTGILRSCTRYVKSKSTGKKPASEDYQRRLKLLIRDYNSVGITAVADRSADSESVNRYRLLKDGGELTVRMTVSRNVDTDGKLEDIQAAIRKVAEDPLVKGDSSLRVVGIKTFLDGGMLTGSAYMREPWGVSEIYAIRDPAYRGVLFIPKEKLLPIVETTLDAGLQFTAHSVGDGAVHTLLEVYDELNQKRPVRSLRPCITHSNFMSEEAVRKAAVLGVVLDIQPAWLWLDGKTLSDHFGRDRLRYFQPLSTIFAVGGVAGGGSDHMQKIGPLVSVNPYHPFLGMSITVQRLPRGMNESLYVEEALSREQMIRFYTSNNAYLIFQEKELGSLEAGKLADFVIVDRDLMTCESEEIATTKVQATYLGGRQVWP